MRAWLSTLFLALCLSCATTTTPEVQVTPKNVGPKGGYLMAYPYMGLTVEVVITREGIVRVFGYDPSGNLADIVQYYPRPLHAVEVRYLPNGQFTTLLATDRGRGCLMAKIDMPTALEIARSPNVTVMLH
jgi:hypothetical protein